MPLSCEREGGMLAPDKESHDAAERLASRRSLRAPLPSALRRARRSRASHGRKRCSRRRRRRHAGEVSRRQVPADGGRDWRVGSRGAASGPSDSGGPWRQSPHGRSRRSSRRLQDGRRRASQRQDRPTGCGRRSRGLQEGARQQRAEARHRRRDGFADPRQSRSGEAHRCGRRRVSGRTTPRRCRRFRRSSRKKATRASPAH